MNWWMMNDWLMKSIQQNTTEVDSGDQENNIITIRWQNKDREKICTLASLDVEIQFFTGFSFGGTQKVLLTALPECYV